MPQITERSFEIYVDWLYRRMIFTGDKSPDADHDDAYKELIGAYELGQKFGDEDFCTAILHSIAEMTYQHEYPVAHIVEMAYEGTSHQSDLRELLVHIYTKLNVEDVSD